MKTTRRFLTVFTLCLPAAATISLLVLGGCTKDIEGEKVGNQRPTVTFVNVPPESSSSSVNPIVNWVGSDQDGQIDFFRYIVVRETIVAESLGLGDSFNPTVTPLTNTQIQTFVDNMLADMADTAWTYLYVDASNADPQTSNIIPMEAEIISPVRNWVSQFVFVQAFDEGGLGSEVAFRRFLRNDNPPETRIRTNPQGVPFINSPVSQGVGTGIRVRWEGTDMLDYPTDPPALEFEWKLFGPYDDATFEALIDSFRDTVFVTTDAQVFRFGLPEICDTITPDSIVCHDPMYIVCDTSFVDGHDTVTCDTIIIDAITQNNVYGYLDSILRIEDSDFVNSPYYKVADSSDNGRGDVWVTDTRDSMFNVFWDTPSDTSVQMNFIFWVRSRDDAKVPDVTPPWISFSVIDGKHERDILVLDAQEGALSNGPSRATVKAYWDTVMTAWKEYRPDGADIEWDLTKDYKTLYHYIYNDSLSFLRVLLSHKVLLLADDQVEPGDWGQQQGAGGKGSITSIYTSMQTGMNVWVMMRTEPDAGIGPGTEYTTYRLNARYQYFFGTEQMVYTGWKYWLGMDTPEPDSTAPRQNAHRIEDFVGTLTLNPDQWPALAVDTARMHKLLSWPRGSNNGEWDPAIAALPEVGWQVRSFETEIQYLYKSKFGANEHFMGREYSFSGRPVAHRLNKGLFRTAHWLFTPLSLEQSTALPVIFDMLDWLYDGWYAYNSQGASAKTNTAGCTSPASVDELREKYWNDWWNANGDAKEFYRLQSEW